MGSNGPDDYLRPFYVSRIDSTDVIVTNSDQRSQSPSGFTQMNIMQKLKFTPSKNWQFWRELQIPAQANHFHRAVRAFPRHRKPAHTRPTWRISTMMRLCSPLLQ